MTSFSADSESVLIAHGWIPGRHVDIAPWVGPLAAGGIAAHEAARRFLAEFGGLSIRISGQGVNRAREPFELDPLRCLGEEDRFQSWGDELGRSIVPVGILDRGRFFLGIDENAEILLVETWVASFGRMPLGLDNLIAGTSPVVVRE